MKPPRPARPISAPETPVAVGNSVPQPRRRAPQASKPPTGAVLPACTGPAHHWDIAEAPGTHAPAVCRHCKIKTLMPVHFSEDVLPPGQWRIAAVLPGHLDADATSTTRGTKRYAQE